MLDVAQPELGPLTVNHYHHNNNTVFWIPKKLRLGYVYDLIFSPEEILEAWGLSRTEKKHPNNPELVEMLIPKNRQWRALRPNVRGTIWLILDELNQPRLSIFDGKYYTGGRICTPVWRELASEDHKKQWVQVVHNGQVVFESDHIEYTTEEEAGYDPITKPLFKVADEYINEHFPLLSSDPNAYW
jgi:hypothetical protein